MNLLFSVLSYESLNPSLFRFRYIDGSDKKLKRYGRKPKVILSYVFFKFLCYFCVHMVMSD